MSTTIAIRSRNSKIWANIVEFGQQSLRKIAEATGLSKDSVARGLAALSKRNKYPESQQWETEEGQAWLQRMVPATVYIFGIKGNQGAERIAEFFKCIRVDTHIGVSPTAVRNMKREMEEQLATFQQEQEARQAEKGEMRDIVASGDETFFNDQILLVMMDLISGYLVVEEEADDRSYATWKAKAQPRLQELGLRVRHFISDRGKSLVKLAMSGFGCWAGADIFHAQYDISKWLGRALYGKLGQASKQLKDAEEKLASLEDQKAALDQVAEQKQRVQQCAEERNAIEQVREAYSQVQQAVSAAVHTFSVDDNTPQTSEQVANRLAEQARGFKQIAAEQSVQDQKGALGKFQRQIEDVASNVDAWWLWTKESLSEKSIGREIRHWLLFTLLPVMYWYLQLQKTQNPEMKKVYEATLRKAQAAYVALPPPLTLSKKDLEHWQDWAEWASANFQRASSAVEGRNGCLSQSYHNGRGLTSRRLRALTAIHNYDTRRRDGSTPAQRLYGEQLPDMFEWLIGQMGPLPLPRKARQHIVKSPLPINAVAA